MAHRLVARAQILAEVAQDGEPDGGAVVEELEEVARIDEADVAVIACERRAVVGIARHHRAEAEDASGLCHEEWLHLPVLRLKKEIDFTGMDDVDAAGLISLAEQQLAGGIALQLLPSFQRLDDGKS